MGVITEREKFQLNPNQLKILFSLQFLMVKKDVDATRDKQRFIKRQWMQSWSDLIHDYLGALDSAYTRQFYDESEIKQAVYKELGNMLGDKTWYSILILEVTLFIPYIELGVNSDDDKEYRKLKFKKQTGYIKEIIGDHQIIEEEAVGRFEKAYKKVISELRGTKSKLIISTATVLAMSSLAGILASLAAGPIAVAIFGSAFGGLKGAALTSASLAAAGGGAIAVGGVGMAGGVAVIVGGGALLGLAGGGVGVGAINLFIASSPDLTFLQAARLEVVVKEIILNDQKDVGLAQRVLDDYGEQIKKLKKHIQNLELKGQGKESKKTIRSLEKSLKYMEKTYININVFTSCFNIGMKNS